METERSIYIWMFQANEVIFFRQRWTVLILYVSTRLGLNSRICRFDFFPVLFYFHGRQWRMGSQSEIGIIPILLTLTVQECEIQAKGLASYFLYSGISPTLNLIKTIHYCGLNWGLKKSTIWVYSHLISGSIHAQERPRKEYGLILIECADS